jgi:hypothetical protein
MGKGKQNKFKERETFRRELGNRELQQGNKKPRIVLSFKDFDRNQGQDFQEWEEEKLLALAISKLREVCQLTVGEAFAQDIITQYKSFPPNSNFTHPKHILPDVKWCSMHIQGKECVIGYFEDNVFQVVFLDKNHEFWITNKKNT